MATELSKDPAGDGGDLGWFTKDRMVPEFSAAAFKLKKGEISDPVKTQFGWHIIKIEGVRTKTFPPFEQVKDQAARYVAQKAESETIAELHSAAKIEMFDADGKPRRRSPKPRRTAARRRQARMRRPPPTSRKRPDVKSPESGPKGCSRPSTGTGMAAPAPLSPLAPKKYPCSRR